MIKKIIMLTVVGIALLSSHNASAALWGQITVTSDDAVTYVNRYEILEATLTLTYQPLYFAIMPIYATISIEGSPTFLTVVPSPPQIILRANEPQTVKLLMVVTEHDSLAGQAGQVHVAVRGELSAGGLLREINPGVAYIGVSYNPFTTISLSAPQSIERTSPDKELPFVINVVNYGNSRVIVDLSVEEDAGDWNMLISPSTIIINPKQPGDDTFPFEPIYVTLTSPHGTAISYHNDWEDFSIKAQAHSDSPYHVYQGGKWVESTEEVYQKNVYQTTASFLAKNRGFYIPGFDALLLIAGIALAGMLVAKKKK